jgi:hypothetical protein
MRRAAAFAARRARAARRPARAAAAGRASARSGSGNGRCGRRPVRAGRTSSHGKYVVERAAPRETGASKCFTAAPAARPSCCAVGAGAPQTRRAYSVEAPAAVTFTSFQDREYVTENVSACDGKKRAPEGK